MSDPSIGERLKAERERRGISAQKAADDLHLDAWVIEALEAGDYARIGPSVYAKGYLRKYASILGVSTAEVAMGADKLAAAPRAPVMRVGSPGASASARFSLLAPLIALAVVALVAAALYYHPWRRAHGSAPAGAPARSPLQTQSTPPAGASGGVDTGVAGAARSAAETQPGSGASTGMGATAAAAGGGSAAEAIEAADPDVSTLPPPTAAALATHAPAAIAPSRGAGPARLRLSFSANASVEVRDANGARVFAGEGRANSMKTLAGLGPLRVTLKPASGVQLELNGRAVAIGRQFMSGEVARFEAGADGVLRRIDSGSGAH